MKFQTINLKLQRKTWFPSCSYNLNQKLAHNISLFKLQSPDFSKANVSYNENFILVILRATCDFKSCFIKEYLTQMHQADFPTNESEKYTFANQHIFKIEDSQLSRQYHIKQCFSNCGLRTTSGTRRRSEWYARSFGFVYPDFSLKAWCLFTRSWSQVVCDRVTGLPNGTRWEKVWNHCYKEMIWKMLSQH